MLYLVRHGRTTANAEGRLLGRLDPPLDDVGRAQASAAASLLAGRLRREGPSPSGVPAASVTGAAVRVVTSPLARCRATAEAVASALGEVDAVVDVEVDDRWVELDYGEFDGRPLGDVPAEVWARWRKDPAFSPPGGESLADVDARVARAMDDLAGWFGGVGSERGRVVVVSHVSPIKAAVAWALGVPGSLAWRLFLSPGSISEVALAPGRHSLHSFNERPPPPPPDAAG